jgi:hypothetical protein
MSIADRHMRSAMPGRRSRLLFKEALNLAGAMAQAQSLHQEIFADDTQIQGRADRTIFT